MIGQDKIIEKFNTYTFDTLPHSNIIVGEFGSGRHTAIGLLANRMGMNVVNLDGLIKLDIINDIQSLSIPTIYVIDGNGITQREEGVLLKFLEEPSSFAYIFVTCTNSRLLLDTIVNRCQVFTMQPYTMESLRAFSDSIGKKLDDRVLSICNTPGKILAWCDMKINDIIELCEKMLSSVRRANFSNVLSISDKINFSKESVEGKFDKSLFLSCLIYQANKMFIDKEIDRNTYCITSKFVTDTSVQNIDIQKLFESYLCDLKMTGNR